jgi:hypothetical protein
MNFVNGRDETVHLERGESFGIPAHIYQCLAQAAISANELAGIEPVLLEPLESGKPGALCCLYGKQYSFSILIECANVPHVVVLSMVGLDDFIPPEAVVEGHADSLDVWRAIVALMLQAEGFVGATLDETEQ